MGSWLHEICSCFAIILKFHFLVPLRMLAKGGVVLVWCEAALPMYYIVRITATRSMPRSHAGYLWTSQPHGALKCYVSTEFPICISRINNLGAGRSVRKHVLKCIFIVRAVYTVRGFSIGW